MRLASYLGMGLGIYYMFINLTDEFRCDKSDEVWVTGAAGMDQCLLPNRQMSTAAWRDRAKSFEKKRLEIITHANRRKLRVELRSQIEQAEIEAAAMTWIADKFVDECYAHTTDYIEEVWEYENGIKREHLNVTRMRYAAVEAATLAMTPNEDASDLCHTVASEKYLEDNYNQCPEWHFSTGELVRRDWVVLDGTTACNETWGKKKANLGSQYVEQSIEQTMTKMLNDDDCGNTMWVTNDEIWCVRKGEECVDTTASAIRLEHKADHAALCDFRADVRYAHSDPNMVISMNGTDGWNAANFTWYCQYMCSQNPSCVAFSRGPEFFDAVTNITNTSICELFLATPTSQSTQEGWTSGPPRCEGCRDTAASCENSRCHDPGFTDGSMTIQEYRRGCMATCGYCERTGLQYDMRCGWQLSCEDTGAQDTCGTSRCPDFTTTATTSLMWTTTEGPAHQNANTTCLYEGDIHLRVRLNVASVDHAADGSLVDDGNDPRFVAEWNETGAGYGTEVVNLKITVVPGNNGQVTLTIANEDSGAVIKTETKTSNEQMEVDCNDLGGCGYDGRMYIGCQETRSAGVTNQSDIVVNMNGCWTTPTARWQCIQDRLTQISNEHSAATDAINAAWTDINTTMQTDLSNSYDSIKHDTADFTGNVLAHMKEVDHTRDTVALIDSEIVKVQEEYVNEIDLRYDNYTVDVGERYRVGCAHRSASDNWGLGSGRHPNDETDVNDYIKASSDFQSFLLRECTSAAESSGLCSHDWGTYRKDMSLVYGEGSEPLLPPMKMPAWTYVNRENRPLQDRYACLDMPCLANDYSHSCRSMALNQLVYFKGQSNLNLCITSSGYPTMLANINGAHGWHVLQGNMSEGEGLINLALPSDHNYLLAIERNYPGDPDIVKLFHVDEIAEGVADPNFAMVDAGDGKVYLQGNRSLVLAETTFSYQAQRQWSDSSKWYVTWTAGGVQHNCESVYNQDSGDRVHVQWMSECDTGSLTLGRERWRWSHTAGVEQGNNSLADGTQSYTQDGGDANGAWSKVSIFNVSCVGSYAAMADRWTRWKATKGERVRERLESEAYDKQFDIMQEAWRTWKNWETSQSVYAESKITVDECAMDVNGTGMAASSPGFLTSGFRAFGHKSFDCSMAQCTIDQCVKKTTKCELGQSLDEVEYECVDRIRLTRKTLDEMLIGIFGFSLSVLIWTLSFCTDEDDRCCCGMRKRKAAAKANEVSPYQEGLRGVGQGWSDEEEEILHKRGGRGVPKVAPPPRKPGQSVPGQVESNKDR